MVGRKNPVVQRSLRPARARNKSQGGDRAPLHGRDPRPPPDTFQQRRGRAVQHFFWPQLFKFFLNPTSGRFAGELGCSKLAGREIERRKTHTISDRRHCRQKVVLLRVQQRIRRRPGVTTRVTSRRTSFVAKRASSTCSQTATLNPRRISLEM